MKKKLPPGTRGKLVLRSIPTPQAEARVAALLARLAKRTPAERIQAIVRNPPVVLFKNVSAEKGQKLILVLEKAGALAVFVPHRPSEAKRLKQAAPAPRVVETPVAIVPPPGRLRRKWLRILAAVILLVCTAAALTVSLFPLIRPQGLFRPPVPPHADLSGFRGLSADVPSMTDVGPVDMPAVLALQYHPGPDLRFIASFRIIAEHFPLFSGRDAAGGFSIGEVETDGSRVRVPVLEDGALLWEATLPVPVGFENALAACRELFLRLCDAAGNSPCIGGASPGAAPAEVSESTATLAPMDILETLYRLEALRIQTGPRSELFRAGALASARLLESLSPDVMAAGDRIAAYGLALLAAAVADGNGPESAREEAELAKAMGYSSHAARLTKQHPDQFAEPYGKMFAACLAADLPAMKRLLDASPPAGAVLLAARTYRHLGLLPRAGRAASLLVKSNPDLVSALPDEIVPERPGSAEPPAAGVLGGLLADFPIDPGPAEAEGVVPPERFTSALADEIRRRWAEDAALLIDRDRAASTLESVYARALLMQIDPQGARPPAIRGAPGDSGEGGEASPPHPLALFVRAALRHRAGESGPADKDAAALISRPDVPLLLCRRAWQWIDDDAIRLSLGPAMAQKSNGGPDHRMILAGVLEDLLLFDAAEKRLREAAEALPRSPGIYRALCRLTGSAAPLEAALAANPGAVWLLAAAGQYWAEKDRPEALRRSLAYFKEAGRLEPGNPVWVRKSAAVLHRMGDNEAADTLLEGLGTAKGPGGVKGPAEDRLHLAHLYLEMGRVDNALALIEPELNAGRPEAMALAARAHEIDGQYGRALAAFREVVKRYPSTPSVLSAAAAFNWRVGRYQQAAGIIARGRPVAGPRSRWYIDDFRQVFASAPAVKARAAVDALKESGAGPRELEELAFDLRDEGRDDLALAVLAEIDYPTARQQDAAADAAARIALRWKGPEAAAERIAGRHTGTGELSTAEALFQLGLYARALEAAGDPKGYPKPLAERAWLIRTLAWIGSDRKPARLEEEITEHYRGSWLQRKAARVTGVLSRDPFHAAGRFLMGMITVDEMMAWATTPVLRCRFAYYAGFAERMKKRYPRAADWYAACRAAGEPEIVEYRWAGEELSTWARTGTAHRHRTLAEDQSFLWGKGGAG